MRLHFINFGFILATLSFSQSPKDGKCAWVEISHFTRGGTRLEYVAPNRCIPMDEELSRIITCVGWGLEYKEFFSQDCSGIMGIDEKIKTRRRMSPFSTRNGIITDFDCSWALCRIDQMVGPIKSWSISRPGDKAICTKSGETYQWVSCLDDKKIGAFQGQLCRNSSTAKQIEGEAARSILNSVSGFDCDGYGYVVDTFIPVERVPAFPRYSFNRSPRVNISTTKKKPPMLQVVIYVMIPVFSILGVALLARRFRLLRRLVRGSCFLVSLLHSNKYEKVSTLETDTDT